MAAPGIAGGVAMEDHIVAGSQAVVLAGVRRRADQGLAHDLLWRVHVTRLGQYGRQLRPIARLVRPDRRPQQGAQDGSQRRGIAPGPFGGDAKHLVGAQTPELSGVDQDLAIALRDGQSVPRRAHTIAVDVPRTQHGGHAGRRDDHQPDIPVGIHPALRKPVAQLVIVHRIGEHHGEGQRRFAAGPALLDQPGQGPGGAGRGGHALGIQRPHRLGMRDSHGYGAAV